MKPVSIFKIHVKKGNYSKQTAVEYIKITMKTDGVCTGILWLLFLRVLLQLVP